MPSSIDWKPLIEVARAARQNAVAGFSGFKVGAAVLAESGKIFAGCNIENATYGLTVCAERVALWKALSEGERRFQALAVLADTDTLTPPCGACRQLIWEFAGDIPVLLGNMRGKTESLGLKELLPRAFDASFLRDSS
jgi:cytidine deaminase